MEIHAHGFLLLGVLFWRGLSRILRGILRLSISGSQPLAIDLRHWPQIWRRAKYFCVGTYDVLTSLSTVYLGCRSWLRNVFRIRRLQSRRFLMRYTPSMRFLRRERLAHS